MTPPHESVEDDTGFTLIELMVAIAIVGVLLAIAIPTFTGFLGRADDISAQTTLRIGEETAQFIGIATGSFPANAELLTLLPQLEPNIEWVAADVSWTGPLMVSISRVGPDLSGIRGLSSRSLSFLDDGGDDDDQVTFAVRSDSGKCFYTRVSLNSDVVRAVAADAASCVTEDFQSGSGTGW